MALVLLYLTFKLLRTSNAVAGEAIETLKPLRSCSGCALVSCYWAETIPVSSLSCNKIKPVAVTYNKNTDSPVRNFIDRQSSNAASSEVIWRPPSILGYYYTRQRRRLWDAYCLFVCLSVCMYVCICVSVSGVTQKAVDGFRWNFLQMESCWNKEQGATRS